MLSSPEAPCEFCERKERDFGTEPGCETCPFATVSDEDRDAWDLYRAINNQFVYDFHALPLVFEIYNVRCTRGEAKELLEKLGIIHGMVVENRKEG